MSLCQSRCSRQIPTSSSPRAISNRTSIGRLRIFVLLLCSANGPHVTLTPHLQTVHKTKLAIKVARQQASPSQSPKFSPASVPKTTDFIRHCKLLELNLLTTFITPLHAHHSPHLDQIPISPPKHPPLSLNHERSVHNFNDPSPRNPTRTSHLPHDQTTLLAGPSRPSRHRDTRRLQAAGRMGCREKEILGMGVKQWKTAWNELGHEIEKGAHTEERREICWSDGVARWIKEMRSVN